MQKIKDFGKSRAAGFYVTAGAALLSLISAILYAVNFSAEPEMSPVRTAQ